MMKIFRFFIILLLMGGYFQIFAQSIVANNITYIKDVEIYFSQGVNDYRLGKYQQAKDMFLRLVNEYPIHQRITIVQLMLGKTYYKLKQYDKAYSTLQNLITEYPQSNYVDDAHYVLGSYYYNVENFMTSVREFLWVADYGKDKKLVEKSRKLALKVIEYNLTLKEIEKLKAELTGDISNAILTIKLAQKWDNMGNQDKAVSLMQKFIDDYPRHEYIRIMREVLKKIKNQQKSIELKVGVILPLSSEFMEQAKSILSGIKYAQYKFSQNLKHNIELVVKDSEGSIVNCIESAHELVKDDNVIAIIGELESEKTASIAPIVDYNGISLIAPVASENGLASLSKYIFQVNGDLERRGSLLAEFAIEELGHKTFATLAPADNYGNEMTDSFTATVDKLNGEIIAQKWYYGSTQDLARQFKSIRDLGFNRMNKDSLIFEYTKNLTPFQKAKFKEEEIPITSIDAVFFPIYTEDIKYIVPQFAFANIRAQILGGQYWYDIDELRNKNIIAHVDSLIFESDYFFNDINTTFRNFRTDFRKVMGKTPEEMECYGYDAMLIIIDAIANNATSRESIRNHLDNLSNFKGIRGPITFKDNNRVNSGQRIISYLNGRFVFLK